MTLFCCSIMLFTNLPLSTLFVTQASCCLSLQALYVWQTLYVKCSSCIRCPMSYSNVCGSQRERKTSVSGGDRRELSICSIHPQSDAPMTKVWRYRSTPPFESRHFCGAYIVQELYFHSVIVQSMQCSTSIVWLCNRPTRYNTN